MIVVFSPETQRRLDRIEADEGIPAVELVRQAVDVWSLLTASERREFGFAAMQTVLLRIRKGGDGGA